MHKQRLGNASGGINGIAGSNGAAGGVGLNAGGASPDSLTCGLGNHGGAGGGGTSPGLCFKFLEN